MSVILFGEFARGIGQPATRLDVYVHNRQWEALERIDDKVDQMAAEVQAEVKRMGESARRSIGQLTRPDHWRRRVKADMAKR